MLVGGKIEEMFSKGTSLQLVGKSWRSNVKYSKI